MIKFLFVLSLVLVVGPFLSFAAEEGIVPCGNPGQPDCTFDDLEVLATRFMRFLLFRFMIPLAVLSLSFVGFQYLTASGDSGKLSKATATLWDVLWGIFIALASWTIIYTIFSILTIGGIPSISG